jgi:2-oxoglutarate ferredoxin oxidoreductase subunit delta
MRPKLFNRENARTAFIQLDTRKCKACWKCNDSCPNQVLGKVDLPWHKHALIIQPDECTGCLKCIKACQYEAISKIDTVQTEMKKKGNMALIAFIINNLLLVAGIVMILSGLTMQLGFHVGEHGEQLVGGRHVLQQSEQYEDLRGIDRDKIVCGLNYADWSATHKIAIVIVSLVMAYHIYTHWKWYKAIITKRLIRKNIQVITLTVLFLLVAITGLIPWITDLLGSTSIVRLAFIEIHDKIALILVVYLVLHVIGRNKWFTTTYSKLTM